LLYFPVLRSIRSFSEPFIYDLLSVLWGTFRVDVIYMLGYSSILTLLVPKLLRKTVIVNVDGLESKRPKFDRFLKFILLSFEKMTPKIANYVLVDSEMIGQYYRKNYGISPVFVPNGGGRILEFRPYEPGSLRVLDLEKGRYYLVVARLEPDNNTKLIVEAFKNSSSELKLAIVGPLIRTRYVEELLRLKDDRILFLGGIYEPRLQRTLRFNCFAYIHGHEMGGTNPSLLEALSCSNTILALDVPFNKEVAGDSATYFKKDINDLKEKIELLEAHARNNKQSIANVRAREIFDRKYSGDKAIDAFSSFLKSITG
jgi:glycosyltransferase involved in cell wall biosynthesis